MSSPKDVHSRTTELVKIRRELMSRLVQQRGKGTVWFMAPSFLMHLPRDCPSKLSLAFRGREDISCVLDMGTRRNYDTIQYPTIAKGAPNISGSPRACLSQRFFCTVSTIPSTCNAKPLFELSTVRHPTPSLSLLLVHRSFQSQHQQQPPAPKSPPPSHSKTRSIQIGYTCHMHDACL